MSGSKITGTSTDFIFRAPSRRTARAAALRPTASGSSSRSRLRAVEYQKSRCISPLCEAIGDTLIPKLVVA